MMVIGDLDPFCAQLVEDRERPLAEALVFTAGNENKIEIAVDLFGIGEILGIIVFGPGDRESAGENPHAAEEVRSGGRKDRADAPR